MTPYTLQSERSFLLKTPLQLGQMSKDELIKYIDEFHNALKNYQLVIDTAINKNIRVR